MRILAIETSCDETSVAILEIRDRKLEIKSNIVSSQVKIHRRWGGVVPMLAKREHQRNLVPVLKKALLEARLLKSKIKNHWIERSERLPVGLQSKIQAKNQKLKEILNREEFLHQELKKFLASYQKPKIDFIAVTTGPGLEPALWAGVNFAKALSYFWHLPIIPVNHIEAHIFAHFINKKFQIQNKTIFPALTLSVSGGHTQLILMKDYGKYELLGETRDDTAGESFDKVARMLGLGYPGGPVIEKLAKKGNARFFYFPRPMIHTKDYDFSFSGLKTAVLYFLKKHTKKFIQKYKNDIAVSFQQAVIDVLVSKTIKAAKNNKVKTIILGGGVAANEELRRQLGEAIRNQLPGIKYIVPDLFLCTDNAAMVAMAAYFHWLKKEKGSWKEIIADANLKI